MDFMRKLRWVPCAPRNPENPDCGGNPAAAIRVPPLRAGPERPDPARARSRSGHPRFVAEWRPPLPGFFRPPRDSSRDTRWPTPHFLLPTGRWLGSGPRPGGQFQGVCIVVHDGLRPFPKGGCARFGFVGLCLISCGFRDLDVFAPGNTESTGNSQTRLTLRPFRAGRHRRRAPGNTGNRIER